MPATMMPRAGGVYVFFREAYGPAMGFLYGWTLFLVVQTGTIAAVAIAFAKFLGVFVPAIAPDNYLFTKQPLLLGGGYAISLSTQQLVAIALVALLTWTNTRGLKLGTLVQNTMRVPLRSKHRFTLHSKPTTLQQAAFRLLDLDPLRVQ